MTSPPRTARRLYDGPRACVVHDSGRYAVVAQLGWFVLESHERSKPAIASARRIDGIGEPTKQRKVYEHGRGHV